MAQAYSAGLTVTESTVLRKERILPLKGDVLVKKGDKVKANDLVAQTFLPGKVIPLKLANKLGVQPSFLAQYMKVKPGEILKKGQILAETKGFLGLFKSSVRSPIEGELESISQHTGQALLREPKIPIQVKAFIDGIIVDVIENEGVVIENKSAYVQGIFGLGHETNGEIKLLISNPEQVISEKDITEECRDKIIVTGALLTLALINKARSVGVKGIITAGIEDEDIKKLLGYDIGVAITGHEDIGMTIVVTEGFGKINMAKKTLELLQKFEGFMASIHGMTQIRAGVIRPEIIIPLTFEEKDLTDVKPKVSTLEIGELIRIIRQPNFGHIGKITALPEQLFTVESETKVRILEAELEDGTKVTLPRANVEVIEA
jgi:hypothetical protein